MSREMGDATLGVAGGDRLGLAAQGVEGVFAHGDPIDQDVAAGQLVELGNA